MHFSNVPAVVLQGPALIPRLEAGVDDHAVRLKLFTLDTPVCLQLNNQMYKNAVFIKIVAAQTNRKKRCILIFQKQSTSQFLYKLKMIRFPTYPTRETLQPSTKKRRLGYF